ncbi:hypothetical protein L1N85_11270 [Paenibacillus alkaliterrae]|uniref:DUF7352 domain-containing protein n=1 Tax=Paenibacillus alkaliterrae TaxID=320909 RepID=UPI001F3CF5E1|nr:hypothetical protein [Paenibacillus alkaliterrae]MCF2939017.1 hypothetical protein [Paenibacillus alkaliterrae]
MTTVYKYFVPVSNLVNYVSMPVGSRIISAIEQNGAIIVYALVPTPVSLPIWDEAKRILVLGTGQEFNDERENEIKPFDKIRFISTVKIGPYVWHVSELVEGVEE